MELTIRPATAEDYPAVNALVGEVQTLHVEHEPNLFKEPPEGIVWSKEQYLGYLEGEGQLVLIAEAAGQPVGFLYALVREAPPLPIMAPRRYVVVDSIGVTARMRGCGVGKRLMQRAEAWAREQGASEFELSVHTFNQNAVAFYTLFGMKPYMQRMSKPLHVEEPAHKDVSR